MVKAWPRLTGGLVDFGPKRPVIGNGPLLAGAALSTLMDAVPGMVFLTRSPPLEIVHANSRAWAAYRTNPRGILVLLHSAIANGFRDTPEGAVVSAGAPGQVFVMLKRLASGADDPVSVAAEAWHLTPRQRQTVALLLDGVSNREIARALNCSMKTIEKHVSAILAKANVPSRAVLVAKAASLR